MFFSCIGLGCTYYTKNNANSRSDLMRYSYKCCAKFTNMKQFQNDTRQNVRGGVLYFL